jgi:hypothetical protein
MEKHLDAEVLFVLNWIETHIKLCKQLKTLNVAQLQNFFNFVKREVEETEAGDVLKSLEEGNIVVRHVEGA